LSADRSLQFVLQFNVLFLQLIDAESAIFPHIGKPLCGSTLDVPSGTRGYYCVGDPSCHPKRDMYSIGVLILKLIRIKPEVWAPLKDLAANLTLPTNQIDSRSSARQALNHPFFQNSLS
jgi:hypothetical protein